MDFELWTSKHAPRSIDDILDSRARDLLRNVSEENLNAVIYGPKGAGKSAAVRALARQEFGSSDPSDSSDPESMGSDSSEAEDPLFVLNASDFFGMTKDEIASDPRFRSFITSKRKRNSSKADLMNHILKEIASHSTVEADFKILLIDNAEEMRRDFQQALRRVMERYSSTCQFVLTTRSPSALIPAIRSRCFSVPFSAPSKKQIADRLEEISQEENLDYEREGLEFIAEEANGDLRSAIITLQTVSNSGSDSVTMESVFDTLEEVGEDDVGDMLELAYDAQFDDAVDVLDNLLIDQGYSGSEILERVLEESKEFGDKRSAELVRLVGDVETEMNEGNTDRIHIERLLATISD